MPSLLSRTSRTWEGTPRRVNSFLVHKVPQGAAPANWAHVLLEGRAKGTFLATLSNYRAGAKALWSAALWSAQARDAALM